MFSRFQIRLLRTSSAWQFARRACSGIPSQWRATVTDLLKRTEALNQQIAGLGGIGNTHTESYKLFNDWRHILFQIPPEESKLLNHSANSIDKLLHVHLDELLLLLLSNTNGSDSEKSNRFQPSPLLLDDLTTGIYAWGRTATNDKNSPLRAEALFEKFVEVSDHHSESSQQQHHRTHIPNPNSSSKLYSALVYCWSQAARNDMACEKCLGWFQKIRDDRAMAVDAATWNALLRIHVRQRKFSSMDTDFLREFSSLNDGYTFVSLVEGWTNSGLPESAKLAREELQRGIAYCMNEKEDQIPALQQLLFVYFTQSTKMGHEIALTERVLHQAIGIQENHPELEVLDAKHFVVVMNALAAKGKADVVHELYETMNRLYERGAQRLRPNYQILVIVLSAITKKRRGGSLEMAEDLLSTIEAFVVSETKESSDAEAAITNHAYNVMLDFYVRSPHVKNRRERAETLMARMKQLAIEHDNPRLHPDTISYTALMKAIIKEGQPGFFSDVDGILKTMEHSNQNSMQPDRMVYSIVLESLCQSDDDGGTALLRAKDLVERMKTHTKLQPDRVTYTILMKILSLVHDVRGSDEALDTMIQAFQSGRTDCLPNEAAFVTAMNTWEQSGRRDSWDGALRIFNRMTALYSKGHSDCRPSIISFGKLMVVLAKSKHDSKMQIGRRLLSEMDKYGIEPDVSIFNWYIRVCATVNSKERNDQRESWDEALSAFLTLRKSGTTNSHTYNSIFHACDRLLKGHDGRDTVFREIFAKCQDDGKVDRRILLSLKRFLPSKAYGELTTLDPRDNGIQMKNIPASWRRNIDRR